MGRGGGGKGRGGGDKTGAFFTAIEGNKTDTVRWSLVHGGIELTTCNDNGETGLMVAAYMGRVQAMETMLDQVGRMRSKEAKSDALNARDGEGRTPLILAAAAGRVECVKLLKEAGAALGIKDEEGYTARERAEWAGKQAVVDALDGKEEESSEEEEEVESDGGFEGETSTQRRKRKKREMEGVAGGSGMTSVKKQQDKDKQAEKEEEEAKAKSAPVSKMKPVLQEIADALKAAAEETKMSGSVHELKMSLIRTEETQAPGLVEGEMDPALWRVGSAVRHLYIKWRPGLGAGSLDAIGSLKRILHLGIHDSGLPSLPEELCELTELRSLEVDGNALTNFPSSIKKLASTLESVSAIRNKLTSKCLINLAPLDHLVSLKLDQNLIEDLEDLALKSKIHLVTLSLLGNKLKELPEDPWSNLIMLQHFDVSNNKITELPCEMGEMKEKKLTNLVLDDNPWKDGKIRNMIQDSAVLSNVVLTYLRKMKPKAKGKAKGKPKRKPKATSDSDAESDDAPEKAGDDEAKAADKESDAEEETEAAPKSKSKKKGKK